MERIIDRIKNNHTDTININGTVEECREICKLLKTNTTVTKLYFRYIDDSEKHCKLLGDLLKVNNTITHLYIAADAYHFWNSNINDPCEGFSYITDALEINKSLIVMKIDIVIMSYENCRLLAKLLKSNNNNVLRIINLATSVVTNYDELVLAMEHNFSITDLSFEKYSHYDAYKIKERCLLNTHNIGLKSMRLVDL